MRANKSQVFIQSGTRSRAYHFVRRRICLTALLILFGSISLANTQSGATPQSASSTGTSGWTFVQDNPIFFCAGNVTSCTIGIGQIASTTAGSIWVFQIQVPNHGVTITNVTGGGGTWIHCPNCHVDNPNGFDADAWYNLTGNAGTVQGITATLSGSSGSFISANFYEMLPPPGSTASYDGSGNAFSSAACSTCTGAAISGLTGTDVIIQNPGGGPQANWNAWSAPYITTANGSGICLNCTSGAAPTVQFSGSSTHPEFMAIAFKSFLGTFTPPTKQYSIRNYTANGGQTCTPSGCTLTIPATAAGNLLFLESGDGSGTFITSVSGGGTWVVPSGPNTCRLASSIAGQNMSASCAYVLSSTAGATSLTITMSGSANTAFAYWEVTSTTGGVFSFDTQGSHIDTSRAFNFPGQSLSISGANDVIFQLAWDAGGSAGPSYYAQPYSTLTANYFFFNQAASVILTDSGPSPPIPVWTNPQAGQDNTFVTAVAFNAP